MQKKAPGLRPAVASFLIVLWFATPAIAAPESRLELRGEIVLPPTEEGGVEQAIVFLTGATDPFSAQTRSNPRGRFRFPKLEPGTYNLSILIPGKRERRQTVEVTPSLADARGVVTVTITLDLTDEESRRRAPPGESVSVRELSIPRAARREFARAEKELGKRNTEEALRHLEKAVSIAPQFVRALNILGTVHYQTQSYEKAEHYFRQALKHDPEAFSPLVNLGGTLYSMKRYTDALALNRQAVVARPDDALANAQLGLCYLEVGNYADARTFLLRARTIDPGHFTLPQLSLADIYLRQGATEAARRELEDFLLRHPDSPLAPGVRRQLQRLGTK